MKVIRSSEYTENGLRLSEAHLNNNEAHLSEVIEFADGVPFQLIFGPEIGEGYYLNVGEGVRQLLGIEPRGLTEKLFLDIIEEVVPLYDHIPADMNESRKKFISGEIDRYKAEVLVTIPGGGKKWISDSSIPLKDEETGRVIGSSGILFDITERKQTIAHLARANEKADESERLKTAFVQNLSHEVRTPLNAIIGFSTLLCEPEQDLQQRQQFLDIINTSTDHLLEVIDNVIEISRIDANIVKPEYKNVDINAMLERVYNQFKPKTDGNKISLYLNPGLGDSNLRIETDGYMLLQVMICLAGNAIKFTEHGKVELGYNLKDDKVEFYVSDTGIGIPDEHKPKIFNRFYQAENSATRGYSGTGLGLAISKAYTELLGGSIRFESKVGEGSVFWVTLPVKKPDNQ
jgi:signal transduction histidine kinase